MDRQQREAELRTMLTTQRGKEELLAVLKKHAGLEGQGNLPPSGPCWSTPSSTTSIQPGRDNRAGQDADRTPKAEQAAAERAEPGDVKFAEPPGREGAGGKQPGDILPVPSSWRIGG